uniref:Putative kazal type serine protease inhibitor n=1 Tax=Haematobia irritans TaxID=7368 RepID=A0A1L8EHH7_HAEIR
MQFKEIFIFIALTLFATVYGACVPECPLDYSQVCGQLPDGKKVTYVNSCRMRFEACRSGKDIIQVNRGPCKK